mgnify:CR=1 FL=1|jgi:hypothetical protein
MNDYWEGKGWMYLGNEYPHCYIEVGDWFKYIHMEPPVRLTLVKTENGNNFYVLDDKDV